MKKQIFPLLFALSVIGVSLYGHLHPSYDYDLLLDLSSIYAVLRIVAAIVLVGYVCFKSLRLKATQMVVLGLGLMLFAGGVFSIFSPMTFGHLSHYTRIGDIFMAIEGGVLYLQAGLQLPVRKLQLHVPAFISGYQPRQLTTLKPKKLISSLGL